MSSVSVVLATYNGEQYLEAQLASINSQTLTPAELVISDDSSTDNTQRIVSDYAKRAPFPVRVRVNPERLGYAANFLTAAKTCISTYVAFCDQDDLWHPEKLERCVAALQQENAVLCAHTATLIDSLDNPVGSFSQGITEARTWPSRSLPPWEVFFGFTQVFEKQLIDLIDPAFRGRDNHSQTHLLSHDRWVYVLGSSLGRTVTIHEPLAKYRQHGANVYGGTRKSILTRMRGKLVGSANLLRMYAEIAGHRAETFFDLAQDRQGDSLGTEARAAFEYWRSIARIYSLRAELYEEPALRGRIAKMSSLAAQRVYRSPDQGGLGRNSLLKDLGLGVLGLRFSPSMSHSLGS